MQKAVAGLLSLLMMCGSCALAQENVGKADTEVAPSFPHSGYRPLPPHFQPRRISAVDPGKITAAPPTLPTYEQPVIPADGYLWVPGYWATRKSVSDYFWVPGTWVRPPEANLLWTPPYWSRIDGGYTFHAGYWGSEVGFYGGIAYGFGYSGNGYQGGRWKHGVFSYNRDANNLGSVDVESAYGEPATAGVNASRVSFNGGPQGVSARPSRHQDELMDAHHIEATVEQRKHFELAAMDRSLYSKLNSSEPDPAATQRVGVLTGPAITASKRQLDRTVKDVGDVTAGAKSAHTPTPTSRQVQPGEN